MQKTSSIFNSRNIPWAFLLALMVVISVQAAELFVLPINFFTFRVWEALKVKNVFLLPGPFYPNATLSMTEEGILGHHTKFAVKKKVSWETDRHGYRRRNENVDQYAIVAVGDSSVAGCGLTQDDMFTMRLEKKLNLKAYPLAPEGINVFLNDQRFLDAPPEVVIFEAIECYMLDLPAVEVSARSWIVKKSVKSFLEKNQPLLVLLDRFSKGIVYRYAAEAFRRLRCELLERTSVLWSGPRAAQVKTARMLFLGSNSNPTPTRIDNAVRTIKTYRDALKERGIRFIFLPIPDKETIYWEDASKKTRPDFLKKMVRRLKDEGIEVIDIEPIFESAARQSEELLYDADDFHWNAKGVAVAVDATIGLLKGSSTIEK